MRYTTAMTLSPKRRKGLLVVLALLLCICIWTAVIVYVGADTLVSYIGVKNGYLLMFLVSLFGGVSSLGGAVYVTTIITLASGGLNPAFLALASGLGVSVGDTVYYYLGRHGRLLLPDEGWLVAKVRALSKWLTRQNPVVRWLAVYGCVGFTPIPNDILTILLGLTRQPYVATISALVLGNVTHTYLLATLGSALPF